MKMMKKGYIAADCDGIDNRVYGCPCGNHNDVGNNVL